MRPSLLPLLVVMAFPEIAFAAGNVYVAQTAQGSGDGAACTTAHDVAWFNTPSQWGATGAISPGTTVHLCGTISSSLFPQGNGAANSPITILFEPNAKLSAPLWTTTSSGTEYPGAIQLNGNTFIVIDGGTNGIIEATASGTQFDPVVGSCGIYLLSANNIEVKNLTIQNMFVRNDLQDRVGGGIAIQISTGNWLEIHDNHITDAQTGIGIAFEGAVSGIHAWNNTISRINWGIGMGDGDAHSSADDVQFYGNEISDTGMWDDDNPLDAAYTPFHHDGIYPFANGTSTITNLRIFNNYFHGDWGKFATAMVFITGYAGATSIQPEIYDNIFVTDVAGLNDGMLAVGNSAKIYNNTFAALNSSTCLNANAGSDIENNIFYNCGTSIGIHGATAPGTTVDHNLYMFAGSGQDFADVDGTGTFHFMNGLASWQTLGYDTHSATGDPLFTNSALRDFHLRAQSPAIDTGATLLAFATDKDGVKRPQGPAFDLGAYEFCNDCDAGLPSEGGIGNDGGIIDHPSDAGCGCTVVGARSASFDAGALLALVALVLRRRDIVR